MPGIQTRRWYGIVAAVFFLAAFLGGLIFWLMKPVPDAVSAREDNISGAYHALALWAAQRTYPGKALPERAHYAAFVQDKQRVRNANAYDAQVAAWEAIGPHNGAGRTLSLAFNPQNPNTLYAGSASGGLWRSYTAGIGASAWERVSTGFPVLGVASIAFAPGDSSTLYIGTGEVYGLDGPGATGASRGSMRGSYGIGILKSDDGGQTWRKSLDWSANQQRGVQVVRVNPLNAKTVWAGTTEGTYKSLDAGTTWNRVHDVVLVTDLVIHPEDTSRVLIAAGNFSSEGHGLYLTTDGGQTWAQRTGGLPETFAGKAMLGTSASNPNVVYASIGNGLSPFVANATWLCRSDDAGETWRIVSTQDYSLWQGWYSHDVEAHPLHPDELMAAGVMMWKSTDGGATVEQKSTFDPFTGQVPVGTPEGPPTYMHGDNHDVVYHPTDPNRVYFANDAGVWRSTNRGETFESLNGGYQTTQFYTGFTSSQQDSTLAIGGLQDNLIFIYKGTTAWSKFHLLTARGDGAWTAIDPRNDQIMYGSLQFLRLHKSFDGGQTWTSIAPPTGGAVTFAAPFVLGVDNPDVLYGGRAIVYRSNNGGFSWTATNGGEALDGNPAFAMAISHQTSDVLYVATAPFFSRAGVFRTTDGGVTWTNITGTLPDRYPTNIAVDPQDDQRLYLTFGGFGTSHVFSSDNGGDTWQDRGTGLPDVPTSAILIDPLFPDHVYVGNDLGVYVSTDRGATWQRFSEGLPEALLTVDFSLSGTNRKLRVATHGNGVYERSLLGSMPVATEAEAPSVFLTLAQSYPNPFITETTIAYTLDRPEAVTLQVYNSRGQLVRTLVEQAFQGMGRHQVRWNGRDDMGMRVAAGVYFYRLHAGDVVATQKVVRVQ